MNKPLIMSIPIHVTGRSIKEIQPVADKVDAMGLARTQVTNHPVPGYVWFTITELTDKTQEGLLQWLKKSGLPYTLEYNAGSN